MNDAVEYKSLLVAEDDDDSWLKFGGDKRAQPDHIHPVHQEGTHAVATHSQLNWCAGRNNPGPVFIVNS